jgi:glutathione synthase/RimK-type ligase-like ATP-grasp enzyme
MKKIHRLLSKVFAFFYLLIKLSKVKWFLNYRNDAESIVWIKTNPIFSFFKYLRYNDLLSDFLLIEAIVKHNRKYKIVIGKNIGRYSDKIIFYSVSENCNPHNLANYSNTLFHTVYELEQQGNLLFPKSCEIRYWENKAYMQQQFKDLNIHHPETIIFSRQNSLEEMIIPDFPLLVKEIHSAGSRGLYLVNSAKDLSEVISKIFSKGHSDLLIQRLVNMRKDLRLVLHREQVVSYYWRINPDDNWKPTATSFGGLTKFDDLPDQWIYLFVDYLERLGLETAAFDIAWNNDDISTPPLILEISPSYQLNPPLPNRYKNIPYKIWKKKLFITNAYHKEYVDAVMKNIYRLVGAYLSQISKSKLP